MAFEQANISSSSCFSGCFSPSIGKFLTWLSLYQSLAFDFRDPRRNAKRMTLYAQWLVAAITAILIHIGCKRQIKEPTPVRDRSSVSPFQAYLFQSFLWKSETRMGACLGLLRRRQHLEPHHFRDSQIFHLLCSLTVVNYVTVGDEFRNKAVICTSTVAFKLKYVTAQP